MTSDGKTTQVYRVLGVDGDANDKTKMHIMSSDYRPTFSRSKLQPLCQYVRIGPKERTVVLDSSEETGSCSSVEGQTQRLFPRQGFEQSQSRVQFDCEKTQVQLLWRVKYLERFFARLWNHAKRTKTSIVCSLV